MPPVDKFVHQTKLFFSLYSGIRESAEVHSISKKGPSNKLIVIKLPDIGCLDCSLYGIPPKDPAAFAICQAQDERRKLREERRNHRTLTWQKSYTSFTFSCSEFSKVCSECSQCAFGIFNLD